MLPSSEASEALLTSAARTRSSDPFTPLILSAMPVSTEPYNANPTVHARSQVKARKEAVRKEARYLWSSDPLVDSAPDAGVEDGEDADALEDIDSTEIFGEDNRFRY